MLRRITATVLSALITTAVVTAIYYACGGRLGGRLRWSPVSTARGPVTLARIVPSDAGNLAENDPRGVRGWEVLE